MSQHVQHAIIGAVMNAESPLMRSNAQSLIDASGLRLDDFSDLKARAVWPVLLKLAAARRPCTPDAVFGYGVQTKRFRDGDIVWLQEMEQSAAMLDRVTFDDLAAGVVQASRTKSLALALEEGAKMLRGNDPQLPAILATLEAAMREAIVSVDESSTGDMDLAEVGDDWDRSEAGEAPDLIPTGIKPLDDLIGGFLLNLNLIIGAPSEGKSAVIATLIKLLLLAGYKVGLFGLEDGTKWLQRRHVGVGMGIPLREVGRKPRDYAAQQKWAEVSAALAPVMCNLFTSKRTAQTPKQVLNQAAKWKAKGVRIMFVDHGGELDHSSDKVDEHRLRVGLSYKMIRDWAFAERVAMVVVAPTRRKDDRDTEPRPPRIDEVRDSSDLDFAARVCLSIWSVPGEEFIRITSAKVTEGARFKTVRVPKLGGGTLIDPDGAEEIDLFVERMNAAKERKAQKDAERAEAVARRLAEKEAAKAAKAAKKPQADLGLGKTA